MLHTVLITYKQLAAYENNKVLKCYKYVRQQRNIVYSYLYFIVKLHKYKYVNCSS